MPLPLSAEEHDHAAHAGRADRQEPPAGVLVGRDDEARGCKAPLRSDPGRCIGLRARSWAVSGPRRRISVRAGWGLEGLGANLRHFHDLGVVFAVDQSKRDQSERRSVGDGLDLADDPLPVVAIRAPAHRGGTPEPPDSMSRGQSRKKLLAGSFSFSASMNAVCSGQQKPSGSQR